MRLAIVASHQIQYYTPLYRALARALDLKVYYAHRASALDQARSGFGVDFTWDSDLSSGHEHVFLDNVARRPNLDDFSGVDTPGIAHCLEGHRPDAVLVMGWHLKAYWQAIWAAKRAGIPVLVRSDSHLQTPRDGLKRMLKAALYPHALRIFDAALHVGVKSREYFIHYGYPAERLFFTPHCIDNDWFAERATPGAAADLRAASGVAADATVLLFAGKLLALKRPLDFVEAARQVAVQIPKLTLMIAGDGPLANAVTEAARAARLPLVQLGFCNQSRMPAVYAAADALVLPSGSETWGLVANEALACGTPIVVSDACGCAPDLAADGSVGRVAPTGDASALAGAVLDLLAERPSTDAISKKTTRFSIARATEGVLDALSFACAPT